MQATALTTSSRQRDGDLGVGAAGEDVAGVVEDRAEQREGGDRRGEGDEVGDAGGAGVAAGPVLGRGGPARSRVRCVVVMSVSRCGVGGGVVAVLGCGSSWVSETSGRPRSRRVRSRPCRAAWSVTSPSSTVVPSSRWVRVMPSKRVGPPGVEVAGEADGVAGPVVPGPVRRVVHGGPPVVAGAGLRGGGVERRCGDRERRNGGGERGSPRVVISRGDSCAGGSAGRVTRRSGRPSSWARRSAARRLLTPSLA